MDLEEALDALVEEAPPEGVCVVGAWMARLPENTRVKFETVLRNGSITTKKIWDTILDEAPFGRTSLRVHRQKECSCRN